MMGWIALKLAQIAMKDSISISPFGSLLVYRAGYTPAFVAKTIQRMQLRGLRVCSLLRDEYLDNLEFLNEYSFLEALDITSMVDHDLSCLRSLTNLRSLSIALDGQSNIDMSGMSRLKELTLRWRKGRVFGLEKCQQINYVCLIEYMEDDFLPVMSLAQLERLVVKTSTIRTLDGVESFENLHTLELGACRRLRTISMLRQIPKLRRLELSGCPQLDDISAISGMEYLEEVIIADCKRVKDVESFKSLPNPKLLLFQGDNLTPGLSKEQRNPKPMTMAEILARVELGGRSQYKFPNK